MGFIDEDLDGSVQPNELPFPLRVKLLFSFDDLDGDEDGGLNLAEMESMVDQL